MTVQLKSSLSHDESPEITTAYLVKWHIKWSYLFRLKESFPTDAMSHTIGHVLNCVKVNI